MRFCPKNTILSKKSQKSCFLRVLRGFEGSWKGSWDPKNPGFWPKTGILAEKGRKWRFLAKMAFFTKNLQKTCFFALFLQKNSEIYGAQTGFCDFRKLKKNAHRKKGVFRIFSRKVPKKGVFLHEKNTFLRGQNLCRGVFFRNFQKNAKNVCGGPTKCSAKTQKVQKCPKEFRQAFHFLRKKHEKMSVAALKIFCFFFDPPKKKSVSSGLNSGPSQAFFRTFSRKMSNSALKWPKYLFKIASGENKVRRFFDHFRHVSGPGEPDFFGNRVSGVPDSWWAYVRFSP